jgi:hypothetical protein
MGLGFSTFPGADGGSGVAVGSGGSRIGCKVAGSGRRGPWAARRVARGPCCAVRHSLLLASCPGGPPGWGLGCPGAGRDGGWARQWCRHAWPADRAGPAQHDAGDAAVGAQRRRGGRGAAAVDVQPAHLGSSSRSPTTRTAARRAAASRTSTRRSGPARSIDLYSQHHRFTLDYGFTRRQYVFNEELRQNQHALSTFSQSELVDGIFFLDTQTALSDATLNSQGQVSADPTVQFEGNSATILTASASPFLRYQLDKYANFETRYRYGQDAVADGGRAGLGVAPLHPFGRVGARVRPLLLGRDVRHRARGLSRARRRSGRAGTGPTRTCSASAASRCRSSASSRSRCPPATRRSRT